MFLKADIFRAEYNPKSCILKTCGLKLGVRIDELNEKIYDNNFSILTSEILKDILRVKIVVHSYIPVKIEQL